MDQDRKSDNVPDEATLRRSLERGAIRLLARKGCFDPISTFERLFSTLLERLRDGSLLPGETSSAMVSLIREVSPSVVPPESGVFSLSTMAAIDTVTATEREILRRYYVAGEETAAIAAALGIGVEECRRARERAASAVLAALRKSAEKKKETN